MFLGLIGVKLYSCFWYFSIVFLRKINHKFRKIDTIIFLSVSKKKNGNYFFVVHVGMLDNPIGPSKTILNFIFSTSAQQTHIFTLYFSRSLPVRWYTLVVKLTHRLAIVFAHD